MPLIRAFTRVDKEGKVTIPRNLNRKVGFKTGQLIEVKILGKNSVTIIARHNAR